jgi:hypothetical protein
MDQVIERAGAKTLIGKCRKDGQQDRNEQEEQGCNTQSRDPAATVTPERKGTLGHGRRVAYRRADCPEGAGKRELP